jgi:putative ABC transport system permease protein
VTRPKTTVAETNPDTQIIGTTPEAFEARNWTVDSGRAIMASDVDSARNVCVLGASVAKNLFPHSSPLGQKVKFRGINYAVVGVLEGRGRTLGGDQDNFLVIPLSTGLNRFGMHLAKPGNSRARPE